MEHYHKQLVLALLAHFDAMEGTTYLYEPTNRENFITNLPDAIQPWAREVLNEYHDRT